MSAASASSSSTLPNRNIQQFVRTPMAEDPRRETAMAATKHFVPTTPAQTAARVATVGAFTPSIQHQPMPYPDYYKNISKEDRYFKQDFLYRLVYHPQYVVEELRLAALGLPPQPAHLSEEHARIQREMLEDFLPIIAESIGIMQKPKNYVPHHARSILSNAVWSVAAPAMQAAMEARTAVLGPAPMPQMRDMTEEELAELSAEDKAAIQRQQMERKQEQKNKELKAAEAARIAGEQKIHASGNATALKAAYEQQNRDSRFVSLLNVHDNRAIMQYLERLCVNHNHTHRFRFLFFHSIWSEHTLQQYVIRIADPFKFQTFMRLLHLCFNPRGNGCEYMTQINSENVFQAIVDLVLDICVAYMVLPKFHLPEQLLQLFEQAVEKRKKEQEERERQRLTAAH